MIVINWLAFVHVFVTAIIASTIVVGFYALGLRLLVRAGRPPVVAPAEFTDAITVVSEKDLHRAAKAAAKAAKRSPLTEGQRRLSLYSAYACFAVCAIAVLCGILIIFLNR